MSTEVRVQRKSLQLAAKVAQDIIPMAMSAMVIIAVVIITGVNKPWNFHRLEKNVL